jgi:hypothetical protein
MSVVKRTKDGIDILEHALQGVHTTHEHDRLVGFDRSRGLVGIRSRVEVELDAVDGPPEREVIVRMPPPQKSKSRVR